MFWIYLILQYLLLLTIVHCRTGHIIALLTISDVKDIVLIICSIIGASVAIIGLSTWKKQIVGSLKLQTVHNLLRATYHLRDEIALLRRPMLFFGVTIGDDNYQKHVIDLYNKKFDKIFDARAQIETYLRDAEVLIGDQVSKEYASIFKKVNVLHMNIDFYIQSISPNPEAEDYAGRYDKWIINSRTSGDKYGEEFSAILKGIEEFLKPYISD